MLHRMARAAGYAWKPLPAFLAGPARPGRVCRLPGPVAGPAPGPGPRRRGRGLSGRVPFLAPGPRALCLAAPGPAPGGPARRARQRRVGLQGLAVTDFAQSLDRSTVLVLDNASIHWAHVVRACQSEWTAKGLN